MTPNALVRVLLDYLPQVFPTEQSVVGPVIQYICGIGESPLIHLVQFCQALQNVKSDHSQGGSHMSSASIDVHKALAEKVEAAGLPEAPEKPADAQIKKLALKLRELGILDPDD